MKGLRLDQSLNSSQENEIVGERNTSSSHLRIFELDTLASEFSHLSSNIAHKTLKCWLFSLANAVDGFRTAIGLVQSIILWRLGSLCSGRTNSLVGIQGLVCVCVCSVIVLG